MNVADLPVRLSKRRRQRDNPRREMTFLEHLGELRGRLVISVVAIILTTAVGGGFLATPAIDMITLPFGRLDTVRRENALRVRVDPNGQWIVLNANELLNKQVEPTLIVLEDADGRELGMIGRKGSQKFLATSPFAAFFVWIKVAVIIGVVLAVPIWLWQLWLFVAPAFTTAERRAVRPVLVAGIFLFPLGVASAYAMLYIVMKFALIYAEKFKFIDLWPDITKYLSFVLMFMMAFGLVFELPLVLVMLVRLGIVSTQALRKSRPYAIVIMAIAAAVLTPQDPFSMLAMLIPMLILFEIALMVSRGVERRVQEAEGKLAEAPGSAES